MADLDALLQTTASMWSPEMCTGYWVLVLNVGWVLVPDWAEYVVLGTWRLEEIVLVELG